MASADDYQASIYIIIVNLQQPKMLQTSHDSNVIPFVRNNRILLSLLKNQIDRRILKIQLMVHQAYPTHQFNQQSQTNPESYQHSQSVQENVVQQAFVQQQPIQSMIRQSFSIRLSEVEARRTTIGEQNKGNTFSGQESAIKVIQSRLEARSKISSADQIQKLAYEFSHLHFKEDISYEDQATNIKEQIRKRLSHSNSQNNNRIVTFTDRPLRENNNNALTYKPNEKEVYIKLQIKGSEKKERCPKQAILNEKMVQNMMKQVMMKIDHKRSYYTDGNIRNKLLKKVQQKCGQLLS